MRWFQPRRTHPIRLEPQPWTGRERRKRLPERKGIVVAKSAYGIKLDEDGEWLNYSKLDYRGEPFDTVEKGDSVRIEYAEKEYKDPETGEPLTRTFISVIERLSDAPGSPPAPESSGDRQASIVRQTCIKAAAMTLQHGMGTPEEKAGGILHLAGELEKWVNR